MENPPHFVGSVLFGGPSVWNGGRRRRRDEKKKGGRLLTDGVLQFDLTVKYFPGIVTGGKKNMMEVYYKHSCR